MNFWHRLILAYRFFLRPRPWLETQPWDKSDREWLNSVMTGRRGRKLHSRLTANSFEFDVQSTLEPDPSQGRWLAGHATGYRMAISDLLEHAQTKISTAPLSPETEDDAPTPATNGHGRRESVSERYRP